MKAYQHLRDVGASDATIHARPPEASQIVQTAINDIADYSNKIIELLDQMQK